MQLYETLRSCSRWCWQAGIDLLALQGLTLCIYCSSSFSSYVPYYPGSNSLSFSVDFNCGPWESNATFPRLHS